MCGNLTYEGSFPVRRGRPPHAMATVHNVANSLLRLESECILPQPGISADKGDLGSLPGLGSIRPQRESDRPERVRAVASASPSSRACRNPARMTAGRHDIFAR